MIPDLMTDELWSYLEKHSQLEPELLQKLDKETWQKVVAPNMISGHYQGRFLSLISKLVQPKSILEIGTYTGLFCALFGRRASR